MAGWWAQLHSNSLQGLDVFWGRNARTWGCTLLPNVLVQNRLALGLTYADLYLLLLLLSFCEWGDKAPAVRISSRVLASHLGLVVGTPNERKNSGSQVRKMFRRLESLGWVERIKADPHSPKPSERLNQYSLKPFFERLRGMKPHPQSTIGQT